MQKNVKKWQWGVDKRNFYRIIKLRRANRKREILWRTHYFTRSKGEYDMEVKEVTKVIGVLHLYHFDALLLELLERLLDGLIKKLTAFKAFVHRVADRLKTKLTANKQPAKTNRTV
jgi:hypothetical protein